jgi:hypothetical protein
MHIFLVVTFMAIRTTDGIIAVIVDRYRSGGKLRLKHIDIWLIQRDVRGVCPLWRPSVYVQLSDISDRNTMDIRRRMGDLCAVPCSLDCRKTLP